MNRPTTINPLKRPLGNKKEEEEEEEFKKQKIEYFDGDVDKTYIVFIILNFLGQKRRIW
jgi:hypothetical protein